MLERINFVYVVRLLKMKNMFSYDAIKQISLGRNFRNHQK